MYVSHIYYIYNHIYINHHAHQYCPVLTGSSVHVVHCHSILDTRSVARQLDSALAAGGALIFCDVHDLKVTMK